MDQKFCRACGFGLDKIAESVGEQLPTRLDETLQERKNKLERLGVTSLSIFALGILGFFVYMVGYKLFLSQGKLIAALAVLGSLVILGCGLLSVFLFAKANEIQEAASKRRLQSADEKLQPGTTAKLMTEGDPNPTPSVTERTTELLFTERKGRNER